MVSNSRQMLVNVRDITLCRIRQGMNQLSEEHYCQPAICVLGYSTKCQMFFFLMLLLTETNSPRACCRLLPCCVANLTVLDDMLSSSSERALLGA